VKQQLEGLLMKRNLVMAVHARSGWYF
jgi:hypothetical protein